LEFALNIPRGKRVMGNLDVETGEVLYCCLEDNKGRLKRRITKLLSAFNDDWPEGLTLATQWRRLDAGGVEDIRSWIEFANKPRLVILDTLAGVRPFTVGQRHSL
jgi:hypothetical protein